MLTVPISMDGMAFTVRRPVAPDGKRYQFVGLSPDNPLRAMFRLCDVSGETAKRLNAVEG